MATTTRILSRQPQTLDYASPTQFKFGINILPNVEYFTLTANVPGISLPQIDNQTPFKTIPLQGDNLTFDNLEITYIIDEKLENYIELQNWVRAIGFPKTRQEFKSFRDTESQRFPTATTRSVSKDIGDTGLATPDGSMFSDATLTILSSKNNPILEVRFQDVFPLSVGSLEYNQGASDIEYLVSNVTFAYKIYEIVSL